LSISTELYEKGLINSHAIKAVDQLLGEIEKALRAMLRLAKWAADNELTDRQRAILQNEIDKLKREVDSIFAMLTEPPAPSNYTN